eukprot:1393431-Amorphochlora_amoeboformis.AAC.3
MDLKSAGAGRERNWVAGAVATVPEREDKTTKRAIAAITQAESPRMFAIASRRESTGIQKASRNASRMAEKKKTKWKYSGRPGFR